MDDLIKNEMDFSKNNMTHNRNIPNTSVREMQEEIAAWMKTLSSRMEENLLLKSKLAEILRKNYDQNCLEEMEEFQTKFIDEDEITKGLRREVAVLDNLLYRKIIDGGIVGESFEGIVKKLRSDFKHSETYFRILQSTFQDFQKKACMKNKN